MLGGSRLSNPGRMRGTSSGWSCMFERGSSVSGGPSGGFPDPRDSGLTTRWRTWCEGKARLGDASLEERFGCT